MKAYKGHNLTGWFWSEKLDGVRFEWDGSTLKTKTGNVIDCPDRLTNPLPKNIAVSGEVFGGHGHFQHVVGAVRQGRTHNFWNNIKLVAFDLPGKGYNVNQVIIKLGNLGLNAVEYHRIDMIEPNEILSGVVDAGGEGIVFRSANGSEFLKYKPYRDCEAEVVRTTEFSAYCVDDKGIRFGVPTYGYKVEVGQTITVKYMTRYKTGIPRQPSLVAVRNYE